MIRRGALWLAILALGSMPGAGLAHSVGHSALSLAFAGETAQGEWRIAARDLDALLGLDDDHDRDLSAEELARAGAVIADYLLDRLELHADDAACITTPRGSALDGAYLRFAFGVSCPHAPRRFWLRYELFFDHDAGHTAQVSVESRGSTSSGVLTAKVRRQAFELGADDTWRRAREYVGQGILHIWIGYDHVLFLLTLLLPAVLIRKQAGWEAAPSFAVALTEVVKIVSAFTLAHSVTLSLATLGVLHLPSRWVEATIAGSVCLAALNNLCAWQTRRLWIVACLFGLIHGFGFASVLEQLGLPKQVLLLALVAFNAGVELGQLAIVLVFLPLAFAVRRTRWYARLGLGAGSFVVACLGLLWLLERALDLTLEQALGLLRAAPPSLERLWPLALGIALALGLGCVRFARGARWAAAGAWIACIASTGYALQLVHAQRGALHGELAAELQAAQTALQRRAWSRAGDLLARAGQLAQALCDDRARADVLGRTGELHTARADLRRAGAAHEAALALYEELGDDRAAAGSQRALGMLAELGGDSALAARAYRRALALHERSRLDAEAARDAADLGTIYRSTKQYSEAQAMYAQALALREARGDEQHVAMLSAELGVLQQVQARPALAAIWFERAAALHERAARTDAAAAQYANLASARRAEGKLADAAQSYERSLALFRQSGGDARARRVEALLAELSGWQR